MKNYLEQELKFKEVIVLVDENATRDRIEIFWLDIGIKCLNHKKSASFS